ncbi:MAG TPA: hypothetical protein VIJ16_00035 [Gemmatimonadaceae bacterium]
MIALAGLAIGLVMAPRTAHAQFEVDNFEVFLRTTAGTVSGTFLVRNVSDQAQTSQLRLGDWERRIDGTNVYRDSTGVLPGSCGGAVSAFPMTLRLAPQQSQVIRVTYTGPVRATSCWEIVYVGTAPQPARSQSGAQLTVELRQGIKIYVEPSAARPELKIDTLDVARHVPPPATPADTAGEDVLAIVSNPGTIQSRVRARIEYRTLADSVVARSLIDEFPILPGAQRMVRSRMPQLANGHYVVLTIFDYGGSDLIAGQLQIDINR